MKRYGEADICGFEGNVSHIYWMKCDTLVFLSGLTVITVVMPSLFI